MSTARGPQAPSRGSSLARDPQGLTLEPFWSKHRNPIPVVLITSAIQMGFLFGISRLGESAHYLGIPGAGAALAGVIAAVLAGPTAGLVVSLAGGLAFTAFFTDFGQSVHPVVIGASVLLWTLAAVVAGLAARSVRRRAELRERLLSRALTEAVRAREGVERILTQTPGMYGAHGSEEVSQVICAVARDALDADHCSLFRADLGGVRLVHADPADGFLPSDAEVVGPERILLEATLFSSTPRFQADARAEAGSAPIRELLERRGLRSSLWLPVGTGQMPSYLLAVDWREARTTLDPAFLALALSLADQAAVALERAEVDRLHKLLETGLQPRYRDPRGELQVALRYVPGDPRLGLGGDFVDYLPQEEGLAFIIGDVSGHGPDAAALGATLRASWHALALSEMGLDEMVDTLNRIALEERYRESVFSTALVGLIARDGSAVTFANAGHPPPVLVSERAEFMPVEPALPLGFPSRPPTHPQQIRLPETWSLLLYTDGLFEAPSPSDTTARLGLDGLLECVEREVPAPIGEACLDRLLAQAGAGQGQAPRDDIAVLLVSRKGSGS